MELASRAATVLATRAAVDLASARQAALYRATRAATPPSLRAHSVLRPVEISSTPSYAPHVTELLHSKLARIEKILSSRASPQRSEEETTASSVYKDYLYVGPYRSAINERFLYAEGITDVLSIGWPLKKKYHVKGVKYHNIRVCLRLPDDGTGNILEKSIIKKTGNIIKAVARSRRDPTSSDARKILVHCQMGWSRSASIVMAYLIKFKRLTFYSAFTKVFKRRPVIEPKLNFLLQLAELSLREGNETSTELWVALARLENVLKQHTQRRDVAHLIRRFL